MMSDGTRETWTRAPADQMTAWEVLANATAGLLTRISSQCLP
jgi:hypothetical protein